MTATDHALLLTRAAAEAAADKLARDVIAFDVSEQLAITDVFLICSASNDRQVRAVVDAVEEMASAGISTMRTRSRGRSRSMTSSML